jgi:hypothetical protein
MTEPQCFVRRRKSDGAGRTAVHAPRPPGRDVFASGSCRHPPSRSVVWGGSIPPAATTATAAITPAVATATATATTPAAAAAVAATTAAAVFPWLGLINSQAPAVVLLIMQPLDGCLRLGLGVHLDKAEPLAPARRAILNHLCALHRAELREQLFQHGIADAIGQIPNVQLLAHH